MLSPTHEERYGCGYQMRFDCVRTALKIEAIISWRPQIFGLMLELALLHQARLARGNAADAKPSGQADANAKLIKFCQLLEGTTFRFLSVSYLKSRSDIDCQQFVYCFVEHE